MSVLPLREGRVSIAEQAKAKGVEVPVNKTVAEIKALGFDVDPEWNLHGKFVADASSPTGYIVFNAAKFSAESAAWYLAV